MTTTATAGQPPERPYLPNLLADQTVMTAQDWRRIIAAVQTGATVDQLLAGIGQPRTWIGEALAAYDQALTTAGDRDARPGPDFWVARAAAAAAIESARQQRIANLIAWKQLRQSAPASALPVAGDDVEAEIERGLGLNGGAS